MPLTLKKLLQPRKPARAIVAELLTALQSPLTVLDAEGQLLLGDTAHPNAERTPLLVDGEIAGWICGPQNKSQPVINLLEQMLSAERGKEALSDELLDTYRELTILYNLSEHLLARPEPEEIAVATLEEIRRIFLISGAWVLLQDEQNGALLPVSCPGQAIGLREAIEDSDFVTGVIERNEAEIRNGVPSGEVIVSADIPTVSLLSAPLRTEQRVLGSILLVSKPPNEFRARDLKLLNAIALQAAPAIEMARLYQIALDQGRLQQELEMAYQVQASLIPSALPSMAESGWEFAARWRPARELSGDYYDFIPHGHERYGLVVADVADKGLPSALFMVNTRSVVRTAVDQTPSPAAAIGKANRLIAQEATSGLFVTMFYGLLDGQSGTFTYVNAGHNPALHYDAARDILTELRYTGIPIGILEDAGYEENELHLEPGDALILYTDGITEAMDGSLREFGLARLQSTILATVGESAETMAQAIENAVDDFTNSAPLSDDLTLMVARRLP